MKDKEKMREMSRLIGESFKEKREKSSKSRKEVASFVGCSEKTIWGFEKGLNELGMAHLILACKAIGVSSSEVTSVLGEKHDW